MPNRLALSILILSLVVVAPGCGSKKVTKGRHAKKNQKRAKGGGRTTPKGVTGGRIPKLDIEKELKGLPDLRGGGLGPPDAGGPGSR